MDRASAPAFITYHYGLGSNCGGDVVQDKITKITIDELLASDPAAAKAIDEDIRKGDFLP